MEKKEELKKRLKEINKLLKIVDPNKGCLAVDQRINLEVEKKRILKEILLSSVPKEISVSGVGRTPRV